MRSKLATSALIVASLFGATAIASAQTQPAQPAPGAMGAGKTDSTMAPDKMKSNNMKSGATNNMKSGATTGMAPEGATPGSVDKSKVGGRSTARKPAGN